MLLERLFFAINYNNSPLELLQIAGKLLTPIEVVM